MIKSVGRSNMSTPAFPEKQSQSQGSSTIDYSYNSKILLVAVISLSVVISFVILLHVYARFYMRRRPITAHVVREPFHRRSLSTFPGYTTETRLSVSDGLEADVVASLPMFVYKSEEFGNGLDCVVCLSVMEEDEKGRLLPKCKHAFHVGCIDMWLMSHSTCPICRAPVVAEEAASTVNGSSTGEEEEVVSGAVDVDLASEVLVDIPFSTNLADDFMKDENSSSTSSSSSLGCSLKRMLSRSRSENRVFPSVLVN